jgi:hypothetical protein
MLRQRIEEAANSKENCHATLYPEYTEPRRRRDGAIAVWRPSSKECRRFRVCEIGLETFLSLLHFFTTPQALALSYLGLLQVFWVV